MNAQVYIVTIGFVGVVSAAVAVVVSYRTMRESYRSLLTPDITVEQMAQSEEQVREFFQRCELSPGADINEIAKKLDVVPASGFVNIIGAKARMEEDSAGRARVDFKRGQNRQELKFDLAHECGHRIRHDPLPATKPDGHTESEVEQLADYVGIALLMPIDEIFTYLKGHNYKKVSSKQQMKLLYDLCKQYDVDRVTALRRIQEVYAVKDFLLKRAS